MRQWLRTRLLDSLLAIAVLTIVAQQFLRATPEVFSGGAAAGEVLVTLATGYVGAWLFNLINLRLPKKRDKAAVVGTVGVAIAQYSGQLRAILQDMAASAGLPPVPRKPDRDVLKAILEKTEFNGQSRVLIAFGPPHTYLTWIQFVSHALRNARTTLDRIAVAYPHLDSETVSAISAVDSSSLVRIMHNYPEFPATQNANLSVMEDMFWDLWVACSTLGDRYNEEIFPLLDKRRRLHIDADEQAAGEGWSKFVAGSK